MTIDALKDEEAEIQALEKDAGQASPETSALPPSQAPETETVETDAPEIEGEEIDGDNRGLSFKVSAHAADGTLTLALPAVLSFQVGDAYSLVVGCLKRRDEDCVTKFSNAVNFYGEPDLPGSDAVLASPSNVV